MANRGAKGRGGAYAIPPQRRCVIRAVSWGGDVGGVFAFFTGRKYVGGTTTPCARMEEEDQSKPLHLGTFEWKHAMFSELR